MNCGFQTCEMAEKEIGHVNFDLTFVRSNLNHTVIQFVNKKFIE